MYLQEWQTLTPVRPHAKSVSLRGTDSQGFIDAHGHVLEYGYYAQLPLLGSKSPSEIVTKVESFLAGEGQQLPPGSWIEGMGWDQNLFPTKEFPTADDLEQSEI